eukprot:GHVH01014520.1.p1 GENE.GHVH01014520.1~~GHVH01014520.1.p1  ORF type:complete len:247 (-),score=32.65 GHVH01014520.1:134-874(-)
MKIQHCCPNEKQEDIRFIASVFIIGVSSLNNLMSDELKLKEKEKESQREAKLRSVVVSSLKRIENEYLWRSFIGEWPEGTEWKVVPSNKFEDLIEELKPQRMIIMYNISVNELPEEVRRQLGVDQEDYPHLVLAVAIPKRQIAVISKGATAVKEVVVWESVSDKAELLEKRIDHVCQKLSVAEIFYLFKCRDPDFDFDTKFGGVSGLQQLLTNLIEKKRPTCLIHWLESHIFKVEKELERLKVKNV